MPTHVSIAVASPVFTDRVAMAEWLGQSGYDPVAMHDLSQLDDLPGRAIEALIADIALVPRGHDVTTLIRRLGSNRPLLVIGEAGHLPGEVRARVAVLDRPLSREALLLGLGLALAEGRPARRFARRDIEPVPASAHGLAVRVHVASEGGVGIELSKRRLVTLPPYFRLRIPAFGVHVLVKRAWMAPVAPDLCRCGGVVEGDLPDASQPWVDFAREAPAPVAALTLRL